MKRNKRQRGDGQLRQPVPMDRYFPTPEQGLTQAQAAQLAAAGWHNRVEETNLKSTGEIIRENTLTFFNLVFVVLAALLVLAGSFRDMFFLGGHSEKGHCSRPHQQVHLHRNQGK